MADQVLTKGQLVEYTENWIQDNHVAFPKAGEPELTLMEEKALREEAERAVSRFERRDMEAMLISRQRRRRVGQTMSRIRWLLRRNTVEPPNKSGWTKTVRKSDG